MATYKIQAGDTLGALAKRFGTDVNSLASSNGIKDINKIQAGSILNYGSVANPSATGTTSVKPIVPVSPTAHTTPMMSTPAAKTFVQNRTGSASNMSMPNMSTQPKPQISTPAYNASGVPNFKTSTPSVTPSATSGSTAFPTIGGDPNKVFGNINGRDYNYAGEWLPSASGGSMSNASSTSSGTASGANTSGDTVVRGTNSSYTTPDRQAYIDAYKKYMEAQTNNADVAAAKTAYNDYVANMAKSEAGLGGRGFGIPLKIVQGQQRLAQEQWQPEAARLQNAIGIAQTGQTNAVNASKSGVDLEKNLLDFGQSDFTNKNTLSTQDRLSNPNFTLGEGQTHYKYDPNTGKYTATKGPAKTYKPTTTTSSTSNKSANVLNQEINRAMSTDYFEGLTDAAKARVIREMGGNPVDFGL